MVDFDKINERMKMDPGTRALLELGEAILAEIVRLREDVRGARGKASGAPSSGRATGGTGARFGNYGRSKGQPVEGATMQDLEYYAGGCRRSLADPAKSRFHESERVLLAAIEAEIARQTGKVDTQAGDGFPDGPPDDTDVPF